MGKTKSNHHPKDFIKVEETKNYIIQVVNQPKGKKVRGYRRKIVYDKHGYRHVLNLAIVCESKKDSKTGRKCKTMVTSIWHPKDEPKAKQLKEKAKKQGKFVKKASENELVVEYTVEGKLPTLVASLLAKAIERS